MRALLLLLLAACDPDPGSKAPGGPGPGDDTAAPPDETAEPPPPDYAVSIEGAAAFDPLLAPETELRLAWEHGDALTVEVRDGAGATVRTLAEGAAPSETLAWDGRDDAGALLPPGAYTVAATLLESGAAVATAELESAIVRVGVLQGTLGGDRIALCWHLAGGPGMYWDGGTTEPTFILDSIDNGQAAAPIPPVWNDTYAPPLNPVGQNMPAAYAWDARPTLTLSVAGDTAGADVEARIPGWTLIEGAAEPGGTLTFQMDEPLAAGVGVVEPTLSLEWLSGGEVFGAQEIPLRMYAMLGPPTFEQSGLPYAPWVAIIDPALRAIDGTAPDSPSVLSALVQHIYEDLGLSYDTQYGASAYVQYTGWGFDDARFDLTAFVLRLRGSIVNCTDCAAILEAYANMLGASLSYAIIKENFPLNYILAIGGKEFTRCPFGPGGCGFSYHAVTSPDGGLTIYDATLALDGDEDPAASPSTALMVQGVEGEEYLDRLVTTNWAFYDDIQQGSLQ